jgi:hypothetical protein
VALLFLYREVLEVELPWLNNVTHSKKTRAPADGADLRRGGSLLKLL